jgi:endonuclease YncB( thermonuclease family)
MASAPVPEVVTGEVVVLDGDSLRVGNREVRLHGLDAPEMDQPCWNAAGERYPCGVRVSQALGRALMGRNVACHRLDTDRYGRMVARCALGIRDLGQMLVRAGGAVAYTRYSEDYVADEALARGRLRGIWSGYLDPPESWRHLEEGKRPDRIVEVDQTLERFGKGGPAMVPPLRTRWSRVP